MLAWLLWTVLLMLVGSSLASPVTLNGSGVAVRTDGFLGTIYVVPDRTADAVFLKTTLGLVTAGIALGVGRLLRPRHLIDAEPPVVVTP